MDSITCALCHGTFVRDDRTVFFGVEKLLFHGECYDAAVERLRPDTQSGRRLEALIEAARDARSA